MEGNPFGDDPEGLMKYSRALASMGDYDRAAKVLLQIVQDFPDAPQARSVIDKVVEYVYRMLSDGDTENAGPIIEVLKEDYPEEENVQNLPEADELKPGEPLPQSEIPPIFRNRDKKPKTDVGPDEPPVDPDEPKPKDDDNPNLPTTYRGWVLPGDFYTWPIGEQQGYKGMIDIVEDAKLK